MRLTWDNSTTSLEVKISNTIGNVKLKISEKLEIPTNDQILIYNEQPLQDSHTLRHYRIQRGETLDLRLKLRG